MARHPHRPARPRPARPAPASPSRGEPTAGPPAGAPRRAHPASRHGRGPARGDRRGGPGEFLLVGLNPVEAALAARRRSLGALVLRSGGGGERVERLRELAEAAGVPVQALPAEELERMAPGQHHQGVLLRCGPLPLLEERAALALGTWRADGAPEGEAPPLLLALDQVEDPRNLGAVARAAEAFGARGLVVPRDRSAPLSAVASAASAGALERLPVYAAANLARFLELAKHNGFWTLGTAVEGGESAAGYTHDRPAVLVLGNEGRGLRPLVARTCDQHLTIPLAGRSVADGSAPGAGLNVASAAAVLLYQLMTYR